MPGEQPARPMAVHGRAADTAAVLFATLLPCTVPPPLGAALDIAEAQSLAWENKLAKGFNTTDIALEFGLLTAEVGEAFTAWRKGLPDRGEELADVLLYLVALAEMQGIDLDTEVAGKIEKNRRRSYRPGENGTLIRVSGD